VNATRLISNEQALQWPRDRCPDSGLGNAECAVGSAEWRLATCELARELVVVTRTRVAPGTGVVSATTGARASFSSIRYGKADTRRIICHGAQAMLARFGAMVKGGSGAVRLVRG